METAVLRSARVLLFTKDRQTARFLGSVLDRAGYSVSVTFDSEAASTILEGGCFDVVLVDAASSFDAGMNLVMRLKAGLRGNRVTVLAITGGPLQDSSSEMIEALAGSRCDKPLSSGVLLSKLNGLGVPPFLIERPDVTADVAL